MRRTKRLYSYMSTLFAEKLAGRWKHNPNDHCSNRKADHSCYGQHLHCRFGSHGLHHGIEKSYLFRHQRVQTVETRHPAGGECLKVPHYAVQNNVAKFDKHEHHYALFVRITRQHAPSWGRWAIGYIMNCLAHVQIFWVESIVLKIESVCECLSVKWTVRKHEFITN